MTDWVPPPVERRRSRHQSLGRPNGTLEGAASRAARGRSASLLASGGPARHLSWMRSASIAANHVERHSNRASQRASFRARHRPAAVSSTSRPSASRGHRQRGTLVASSAGRHRFAQASGSALSDRPSKLVAIAPPGPWILVVPEGCPRAFFNATTKAHVFHAYQPVQEYRGGLR